MSARVENNNRGQNAGGQQSGENPGSALDQLRKTSVSYSLEEQVIRAELLWVLKMVESDFSFKSAENMVRLLCLMDEGNQIFRKMSLGRTKCGYYVTHALFPFYLEALVNRVQKVPAYTLGVDGGSFKVRGALSLSNFVATDVYALFFVNSGLFSSHFRTFIVEFCRDRRIRAFSKKFKILASSLFSFPCLSQILSTTPAI